ncbi:MAG: ADP-forming succinate--CoA ligase subunit beta [Candidatus Dormibacteria bacterium]
MKLLEYQAKQRFASVGIAVPNGRLARTPDEAEAAARELGTIAIKAQVPIGGRGKAGGIAVVTTPEDARRESGRILGMEIRGYPVGSVWCERGLDIAHELYLGITLDRDRRRLVVIFSAAGGMEIEEVAAENPERIAKLWPDPFSGPMAFELRQVCFAALKQTELQSLGATLVNKVAAIAARLYGLATSLDAVTCEINPLAVTHDADVVAADGKLEIDDNAEYRHRDVAQELARDEPTDGAKTGDDPYEVEARRRGLTYVHLDGSVGVIGNGAGLTMNTLDLVKQQGGNPADFLDIGGGASADKVRNALEMVLLDPAVRGVFINVFGGITRGDEVARGVIAARDELHITKPLVVRMTGTKEEEGRRLLEEAGIVPAVSATEAAQKIVALAQDGDA